eukprot:Rmarinus@m.24236
MKMFCAVECGRVVLSLGHSPYLLTTIDDDGNIAKLNPRCFLQADGNAYFCNGKPVDIPLKKFPPIRGGHKPALAACQSCETRLSVRDNVHKRQRANTRDYQAAVQLLQPTKRSPQSEKETEAFSTIVDTVCEGHEKSKHSASSQSAIDELASLRAVVSEDPRHVRRDGEGSSRTGQATDDSESVQPRSREIQGWILQEPYLSAILGGLKSLGESGYETEAAIRAISRASGRPLEEGDLPGDTQRNQADVPSAASVDASIGCRSAVPLPANQPENDLQDVSLTPLTGRLGRRRDCDGCGSYADYLESGGIEGFEYSRMLSPRVRAHQTRPSTAPHRRTPGDPAPGNAKGDFIEVHRPSSSRPAPALQRGPLPRPLPPPTAHSLPPASPRPSVFRGKSIEHIHAEADEASKEKRCREIGRHLKWERAIHKLGQGKEGIASERSPRMAQVVEAAMDTVNSPLGFLYLRRYFFPEYVFPEDHPGVTVSRKGQFTRTRHYDVILSHNENKAVHELHKPFIPSHRTQYYMDFLGRLDAYEAFARSFREVDGLTVGPSRPCSELDVLALRRFVVNLRPRCAADYVPMFSLCQHILASLLDEKISLYMNEISSLTRGKSVSVQVDSIPGCKMCEALQKQLTTLREEHEDLKGQLEMLKAKLAAKEAECVSNHVEADRIRGVLQADINRMRNQMRARTKELDDLKRNSEETIRKLQARVKSDVPKSSSECRISFITWKLTVRVAHLETALSQQKAHTEETVVKLRKEMADALKTRSDVARLRRLAVEHNRDFLAEAESRAQEISVLFDGPLSSFIGFAGFRDMAILGPATGDVDASARADWYRTASDIFRHKLRVDAESDYDGAVRCSLADETVKYFLFLFGLKDLATINLQKFLSWTFFSCRQDPFVRFTGRLLGILSPPLPRTTLDITLQALRLVGQSYNISQTASQHLRDHAEVKFWKELESGSPLKVSWASIIRIGRVLLKHITLLPKLEETLLQKLQPRIDLDLDPNEVPPHLDYETRKADLRAKARRTTDKPPGCFVLLDDFIVILADLVDAFSDEAFQTVFVESSKHGNAFSYEAFQHMVKEVDPTMPEARTKQAFIELSRTRDSADSFVTPARFSEVLRRCCNSLVRQGQCAPVPPLDAVAEARKQLEAEANAAGEEVIRIPHKLQNVEPDRGYSSS